MKLIFKILIVFINSFIFISFDSNAQLDSSEYLQKLIDSQEEIDLGDSTKTYFISRTINLSDNKTIRGNGAKIIQTAKCIPIFQCSNLKNIVVDNLVFQGYGNDYSPTSSSASVGIMCYGVKKMKIQNCKFYNFSYSPVSGLRNVEDILFANNICVGTGLNNPNFYQKDHTGITIGGQRIEIFGNIISNSSQGIIIAEGSSLISIHDNYIFNINLEHGIYVDTSCNKLKIFKNKIDQTGGSGIKVQNRNIDNAFCKEIYIYNNEIKNTKIGDGILINNSEGDKVYAENVTISNNSLENIGQHAINIRIVKNVIVLGNTIKNVLHSGIYIKKAFNLTIKKNSIEITQESGLFDEGSGQDFFILDNQFLNNGLARIDRNGLSSSIFIEGGNHRTIKNNKVIGDPKSTRYALYLAGGNLSTIVINNNVFKGARDAGIRLPNKRKLKSFRKNVIEGETVKITY